MSYAVGSPVPWLPAGSSELPAERYIIWADNGNLVQLLNESVKTGNGVTFTGTWMSQTLNRKSLLRHYTLNWLALFYTCALQSFVQVRVSGNGGKTFGYTGWISLAPTTGNQIEEIAFRVGVTGRDLRIEFQFAADIPVNIVGFFPSIVERGRFFHGDR